MSLRVRSSVSPPPPHGPPIDQEELPLGLGLSSFEGVPEQPPADSVGHFAGQNEYRTPPPRGQLIAKFPPHAQWALDAGFQWLSCCTPLFAKRWTKRFAVKCHLRPCLPQYREAKIELVCRMDIALLLSQLRASQPAEGWTALPPLKDSPGQAPHLIR